MKPAPASSPESLLRIPLLADLLADASVQLCARQVDTDWHREKRTTMSVAGFQPFSSRVYYGSRSPLAAWLRAPAGSARPFNEGDRLVTQALFLAHDYLHIVAVRAIREHFPRLQFGEALAHTPEAQVFCHLATEAFATVGLDYWYLCTLELNDVVDLGTRRETLTVPYHERWLREYRRFHPQLTVQAPGFFELLCRFYCTGELHGFDGDDVAASPLLAAWLTQELRYGARQRAIARQWLYYVAGAEPPVEPERPVALDARWQEELMGVLGELLWRYVKHGQAPALPPLSLPPLSPPSTRPIDFRFVNVCALADDELAARLRRTGAVPESFDAYCDQQLSRLVRAEFPSALLPALAPLRATRDFLAVHDFVRGHARAPRATDEPLQLLVLN